MVVMLATKRSACVTLSGESEKYILALKTRADVTRGPSRGISDPTKRTNVLQKV